MIYCKLYTTIYYYCHCALCASGWPWDAAEAAVPLKNSAAVIVYKTNDVPTFTPRAYLYAVHNAGVQDTWTERNRRRLPFECKKNENPMYYIPLRSSAVFGFTINLSLNGRVPVYIFWFIKHTYYIRIPPICFHIYPLLLASDPRGTTQIDLYHNIYT